jgi:hypothetical protein
MCKLFLLLLLPALVFGQTTPNSVTVTASRNGSLQPDQVVFSIDVESSLTSSLQDAVNALQGLGITAADFQSVQLNQVSDDSGQRSVLGWSFTLAAPVSNMKVTVALLGAVQESIAKSANGLSMSFRVQALQASPAVAKSQPCSMSGLLADARAQAAKIAGSAGMTVGSALAISGTTTASDSLANPFASASSTPLCSVTVKFALGGF